MKGKEKMLERCRWRTIRKDKTFLIAVSFAASKINLIKSKEEEEKKGPRKKLRCNCYSISLSELQWFKGRRSHEEPFN